MSRKSLSRTTAEAIGPLVVPLVTKVAIPIAIESLRRGKFDSDRFYKEARESLADGYKKSRPQLEDLRDELSDRGTDLYDDLNNLLALVHQNGYAIGRLEDYLSPGT